MSIFSILNHPCSFTVHYYLFGVFLAFYVLFSGFLQFNGNFVDGQKNSKIPWLCSFNQESSDFDLSETAEAIVECDPELSAILEELDAFDPEPE